MTHPPSRLCPLDLRRGIPCKFWASEILDSLPCHAASYPLPVRRTSALTSGFLQTRGHPRSPCHWLTLPLAGRVEDLHLQVSAPRRTHQKNPRPCAGGRKPYRNEAAKHPLREEKREAASYPKASLANIKKDNKVEFILKNTFDIYGADPFWPHPSACLSDWDESPTFGIRRDFRHNFQHEPRRPLPRQPPTPLAP